MGAKRTFLMAAPAVSLLEEVFVEVFAVGVKRSFDPGVFDKEDFANEAFEAAACLAAGFLAVEVIAQTAPGEPNIASVSSAENKTL